jgi:hypothetical protein
MKKLILSYKMLSLSILLAIISFTFPNMGMDYIFGISMTTVFGISMVMIFLSMSFDSRFKKRTKPTGLGKMVGGLNKGLDSVSDKIVK